MKKSLWLILWTALWIGCGGGRTKLVQELDASLPKKDEPRQEKKPIPLRCKFICEEGLEKCNIKLEKECLEQCIIEFSKDQKDCIIEAISHSSCKELASCLRYEDRCQNICKFVFKECDWTFLNLSYSNCSKWCEGQAKKTKDCLLLAQRYDSCEDVLMCIPSSLSSCIGPCQMAKRCGVYKSSDKCLAECKDKWSDDLFWCVKSARSCETFIGCFVASSICEFTCADLVSCGIYSLEDCLSKCSQWGPEVFFCLWLAQDCEGKKMCLALPPLDPACKSICEFAITCGYIESFMYLPCVGACLISEPKERECMVNAVKAKSCLELAICLAELPPLDPECDSICKFAQEECGFIDSSMYPQCMAYCLLTEPEDRECVLAAVKNRDCFEFGRCAVDYVSIECRDICDFAISCGYVDSTMRLQCIALCSFMGSEDKECAIEAVRKEDCLELLNCLSY